MALLALPVCVAYLTLGLANTIMALAIAATKALLIAYMELRGRDGLMIAFAGAGFFWLAIMLWFVFADNATRVRLTPPW